jgi:hypothetical protein
MRLRPEIVATLLLAAAGTAAADQPLNITGLRTDPITLYKDCKMDQGIPVTRQQFQGPWAAVKKDSSLYFWVKRSDGDYCVKAFSVQTDQAKVVDGECGAKVAGRPPRTGAVRGVGGGC